jgi:hypothetical protein
MIAPRAANGTHRLPEWPKHRTVEAMRVRGLIIDTEPQRLASRLRLQQRAAQPIEQRERAAEIAVVMARIGRVVELVMGRAQYPSAPSPGRREPDVRMLKIVQDMSTPAVTPSTAAAIL